MNSGTISVIVTVAFLACLVVGFLRGFFKGTVKSVIDTFLGVLALALAFPITRIIMGALVNSEVLSFIAGKIMETLPDKVSTYVQAIEGYLSNPESGTLVKEALELVSALPTIFIAPLIFIAVFAILALVLFGMGFFIKLFINIKDQKIGGRIFGGLLGAFTYVIVITAFIIPVNGYINMVNDTASHALEVVESNISVDNNSSSKEEQKDGITSISDRKNGDKSEDESKDENETKFDLSPVIPSLEAVIEYTSCVKESPILSFIQSFGGKKIFNSLTTVKTSSAEICLDKELNGLIDICDVALKFANSDPDDYGEVQAEATRQANEIISSSDYIPELLSRVISFVAGEFYEGRDIFGLEKPNLGEDFNPALDGILRVLKDTDASDLKNDFGTLSNITSEALENGMVEKLTSSEFNVYSIVEDKDVFETIFVELYNNTRTRNIIPYVTCYITEYVYALYDDINDTSTEVPSFDYTNYNAERMHLEAAYVTATIKDVKTFIDSIDYEDDEFDPKQIIMEGDFAALGRGLENMRDSIFTDRIFQITIYAILHSEFAEQLAIVDEELVKRANDKNADIEGMLVARQNIMKLAISIQEIENREETNLLIDSVIESLLKEDSSALNAIISKDNLQLMGMSEKQAESIQGIVSSMVNGASGFIFNTSEEKNDEIKKTEEIIYAIANTVLDENRKHHHMFEQDDGVGSTTEMTAQNFVESIIDSKLTSSMIQNAISGQDGQEIIDPYRLHGEISGEDMEQIKNALNNSYANEDATEEDKQTLEALASIFGVTLN